MTGSWTRYAWMRPELAKADDHKHKAYWCAEGDQFERARQVLLTAGAGHRLAFLTASMPDGFFIDVRQECPEKVPYPEDGTPFGAIIGDAELEFPPSPNAGFMPDKNRPGGALPTGADDLLAGARMISRGPNQFHQASLIALIKLARHVTLDTTRAAAAPIYLNAVEPLMLRRENVILIEASDETAHAWMNFVSLHTVNAKLRWITDVDAALINMGNPDHGTVQ